MAKVGLWLRGARGKYAGGVLQKGVAGGTIVRENVTPSNPQSAGQSAQRMKMAPAQQFYLAFSSILSHSFEAVEYGVKSRWYFLSKALKGASLAYSKEMTGLAPAEYQMSEGSLSTHLSISYHVTDWLWIGAGTKLTDDEISALDNIEVGGDRSAALSALRKWMGFPEDFDGQITICQIYSGRDGIGYKSQVARIIFKDTLAEGETDALVSFCVDGITTSDMKEHDYSKVAWGDPAGMCVIESQFVDNKWRRNTSTMVLDSNTQALFYDDAAVAEARKSYQKIAVSSLSERYLNEGEE